MRKVCLALGCALAACGAAERGEALPREGIRLVGGGGEVALSVEVAADDAARRQGLMNRDELCARCGMLFVWDEPVPVAMWMRDTRIPLDMAFIRDGTVVGVAHGKPLDETALPAPVPVDMVLEVGGGRLADWGIGVGSRVIRK